MGTLGLYEGYVEAYMGKLPSETSLDLGRVYLPLVSWE